MVKITEEFINSVAPNQSAVTNGLGLVKKNSFLKLYIAPDASFIMGECKGSGASNYVTSADFVISDSPVFRCTCPSRQIPCKHSIGLLYAYFQGKTFETAEIPQDVLTKREKIEKRNEKNDVSNVTAPKKTNKSALKKKLTTQLEGLELLEKIVTGIVQAGLGTINAKTIKMLEEQAKQLGSYYLTFPQFVVRDFILLFKDHENYEQVYSRAIDQLLMLHGLYRHGTEHLKKRIADSELALATNSSIDEQLGHVWQLTELKELGMVETDVDLVQLRFYCYSNEARKEFIDTGTWINLKSGKIYESLNYRPFKAKKYIREDDSLFSVLQVPELFAYPGDINTRVRWEQSSLREVTQSDRQAIKAYGQSSFAQVIKTVKGQLKNPLADKFPMVLLTFSRIGKIGDCFVAEDATGQRIVLADHYSGMEPASTELLAFIRQEKLHNNALLVGFHQNPDTRKLCAQPMCLITDTEIIRLLF
ncbi:MAG: hypothetical protein H6Q73_2853 [Firmicutes bacterium]|nr:hypothetical protein [Bacillota bacterium]